MPHQSIARHLDPKPHGRCLFFTALTACVLLSAGTAQAQALKYTPTNPHFGGSPFNGADLMASATAQKDLKALSNVTGQSAISAFTSNLDARISAGLSQYISNQLFSASGQADKAGTVSLGSLKIDYQREGTTVIVGMTDTKTGETKTVTYPLNTFVP